MSPNAKTSSAPKWQHGTLIRHRGDTDIAGVVTAHVSRPGGIIQYLVAWPGDTGEREHAELELTTERAIDGVPSDE